METRSGSVDRYLSFEKLWDFCFSSKYRFLLLASHGFFHDWSDEDYIKKKYKYLVGTDLDLDNPRTFTEKLQWLKLHDRKQEYTTMVDKFEAKQWIAARIGSEFIVPTLGVWNKFDDIDFNILPQKFVLKCTHDSGGVVIVRDKSQLNRLKIKAMLERNLKKNFYWIGREWPYKNIIPRIIAEEYLEETTEVRNLNTAKIGHHLTDYKFFCFNGEPKIVYISEDKSENPKTDFFDMAYNHLSLRMRDPNADIPPSKPDCFEKMKKLARILSKGIPHIRVDFYVVNGKVYVGELTFYHCSGFAPVIPSEWNYKLGDWIQLPKT